MKKVRHQEFWQTPAESVPLEGDGIGYMVCQGKELLVIYRVEVKRRWDQDGQVVILPAPNRDWPEFYTPGIENTYQAHGLYTQQRWSVD